MTGHSSCQRRGTSIIEFVVACSLLSGVMLFVVTSAVRIGRVQQLTRHHRIAMDELSNQLDRLTALPLNQIREELPRLTVSRTAVASLPDPRLMGELVETEGGYRLLLRVSWSTPGRREAPLALATWLYPNSPAAALEEDRG